MPHPLFYLSFCSFAAFFIVLSTIFVNRLYSNQFHDIIYYFFENINVVINKAKSEGNGVNVHGQLDPKLFLCVAAFVADTAAVNPYGVKMLLANV